MGRRHFKVRTIILSGLGIFTLAFGWTLFEGRFSELHAKDRLGFVQRISPSVKKVANSTVWVCRAGLSSLHRAFWIRNPVSKHGRKVLFSLPPQTALPPGFDPLKDGLPLEVSEAMARQSFRATLKQIDLLRTYDFIKPLERSEMLATARSAFQITKAQQEQEELELAQRREALKKAGVSEEDLHREFRLPKLNPFYPENALFLFGKPWTETTIDDAVDLIDGGWNPYKSWIRENPDFEVLRPVWRRAAGMSSRIFWFLATTLVIGSAAVFTTNYISGYVQPEAYENSRLSYATRMDPETPYVPEAERRSLKDLAMSKNGTMNYLEHEARDLITYIYSTLLTTQLALTEAKERWNDEKLIKLHLRHVFLIEKRFPEFEKHVLGKDIRELCGQLFLRFDPTGRIRAEIEQSWKASHK